MSTAERTKLLCVNSPTCTLCVCVCVCFIHSISYLSCHIALKFSLPVVYMYARLPQSFGSPFSESMLNTHPVSLGEYPVCMTSPPASKIHHLVGASALLVMLISGHPSTTISLFVPPALPLHHSRGPPHIFCTFLYHKQ